MTDVADLLRSDILAGAFPPGDRLVELQLTDRYDVGRAAVRAALVELETEGLVERAANRGATVRRVTIAEAVEIAEARGVLEGLLARQAAVLADDTERDELARIVAEMSAAVREEDQLAYAELNRLLHRRIREISHHDTAAELVTNLRNRGAHHQFRLAAMPGRPHESLPEHAAIVEAIVAGDGDGAEAAMRDHLASVASVLRSWALAEGG